MDFERRARELEAGIIALRRDFHAHPELSFRETRTAAAVRAELTRLGIPFVSLAENGVVGKLAGGRAGAGSPKLAIRADMDALPIQEEVEGPFKSKNAGVMHACGHDGHTAMLLGAAALLKEAQAELSGTVYFCFQAAEEVSGGAKPILDYLDSEGGVDRAIAAHLWPEKDSGGIGLSAGARMAGCDTFIITVHGRGGHASRPDLCVDPIKPLCQMVLALSAIPTGRASTLEPLVVHVGKLEAGTAGNIFPKSAVLHGGLRSFSEGNRQLAIKAIQDIAEHTARAYGAAAEVNIWQDTPVLVNEPGAVALARDVLNKHPVLLAEDYEPVLASENFACFLEKYPGFMAFIGTRNAEKGLTHTLHHPKFGIDEDVLIKGAAFFALYAEAFLKAE